MGDLLLTNLEKLLPAVSSACTEIGNHLGEFLNDSIDKAFEKIVEILS